MQNWFALSDPAMEERLYEITSLRNFAGLALLVASIGVVVLSRRPSGK